MPKFNLRMLSAFQVVAFAIVLVLAQILASALIAAFIGTENIEGHPLQIYSYVASACISISLFSCLARKFPATSAPKFIAIGLLAIALGWLATFVIVPDWSYLFSILRLFDAVAMLFSISIGLWIGKRFTPDNFETDPG